MKIAVTGGTGFIGQPLVEKLCAAGHEVQVLSRRKDLSLPAQARAVFFDAEQPIAPGLLQGCEAVIHLAGESISERWTDAQKAKVIRSRVEGTEAIARAAVSAGTVKTLISASAIGFYGPHGDEPLDEGASPGNDFLAGVCKSWEAATASAVKAGIRVVNLRIGVVLHPEGGALKKMLPPFRLGVGGKLGSGKQVLSWIHRDDLIALTLFLLEHSEVSGPVNGTAPNPATNSEFSGALGRALHRPAVFPAPAFMLRLALGEMATMVLDGQRVLPKRALASGFTFRYPELQAALDALLQPPA